MLYECCNLCFASFAEDCFCATLYWVGRAVEFSRCATAPELFDADFLYYLLSSSVATNQFESSARGSTVRNLNIELVSKVIVSYPSLPVQKQIVEKLDAAFADIDKAISATQKKGEELLNLKASILNQAFTAIKELL